LEKHEPEQTGEVELNTPVVEPAPDATAIPDETLSVAIAPLADLDPSHVALDPELAKRQASEAEQVGIEIAGELSTAPSRSAGSPTLTPSVAHDSAELAGREIHDWPLICRRTFPAVPLSVSAARGFATQALADIPPDALEVVRLLVSELASNAIEHATTSFHLAVYRASETIRVAVTDYGAGIPTMRSVGPDAVRGRGLEIVDMLSTQWAVQQEADSAKTVWFNLKLAPAPPA
jgi:anti-sigma regulatory factor (Ser/Thr protein kinase)